MSITETEQEAIVLKTVLDLIGDMVNFAMFCRFTKAEDGSDKTMNTNLMFADSGNTRLFNILLVDFLSQLSNPAPFGLPQPPSKTGPANLTYLFHLRNIAANPKLGSDPKLISEPVEAFATWLEGEATVEKVWFPSVGIEGDMTIQRITFLKLCGDIAKHSLARLTNNERKLRRIFEKQGHELEEGQAYLVMPEFYEWFHTNIFVYHSSAIAEFLNNIRWGIHGYLSPCAEKACVAISDEELSGRYTFKPPTDIVDPLAFSMFYDLMNVVRRPPTFPRFTVSEWHKKRY